MRVLVVDDDPHISEIISLYLNKEGYETVEAHTGQEAMELFARHGAQLVMLDIMLPGQDGYQICAELRKLSRVPIIMLTARGETFDKVLGLEIGADDYIVKPFDPKELVARVKAVLRRYEKPEQRNSINLPNFSINQDTYTALYHGTELLLPPKEFELLFLLAKHPNRVFTREQLLERIWGYEFIGDTRTVDVHIKRIRGKMRENDHWGIKTVWGVGYKFVV